MNCLLIHVTATSYALLQLELGPYLSVKDSARQATSEVSISFRFSGMIASNSISNRLLSKDETVFVTRLYRGKRPQYD